MNLRVYKCGFFWKSGVFVGGLGGVGTWILVAHGLTRIRHGFKRFLWKSGFWWHTDFGGTRINTDWTRI